MTKGKCRKEERKLPMLNRGPRDGGSDKLQRNKQVDISGATELKGGGFRLQRKKQIYLSGATSEVIVNNVAIL